MENNNIKEDMISKWVKDTKQKPLTRTQYNFLLFLLEDDVKQQITQLGDLDSIFSSFRYYLKQN